MITLLTKLDSGRHSVQKQLVLINGINQVAWIVDLTTDVGLVSGPDYIAFARSCFIESTSDSQQKRCILKL